MQKQTAIRAYFSCKQLLLFMQHIGSFFTLLPIWPLLTLSRFYITEVPANTGLSPNDISMLVQRRKRWANIETALGEWPVFVGVFCHGRRPYSKNIPVSGQFSLVFASLEDITLSTQTSAIQSQNAVAA